MQVLELMVRDMGQLSHIECSVKRQKWTHVLQALKLTPDQREQVMGLRREHLNKLRGIFQDRQGLNMQVAAFPPCPWLKLFLVRGELALHWLKFTHLEVALAWFSNPSCYPCSATLSNLLLPVPVC